MQNNIYIYIFIMAICTAALRILPLTLIKKQIENRFVRSFLYYVPYVTLAVMTFPAILNATAEPISGAIALVVGVIVALLGGGLFGVAFTLCGIVIFIEYLLPLIF